MNRQQLIDAYSDWLTRFKWSWFGTLTFRRSDIPFSIADRTFNDWIRKIERNDGADDFHWFRVTERGAYGCNLHFHVLVGGLRNGSKWPWVLRWNELAGDCILSYYRPYSHGIRYMLKEVCPGRDFEIEMEFPPTAAQRQ